MDHEQEHIKQNEFGRAVFAHLQRETSSRWDFLAVAQDLNPLTFWQPEASEIARGAARNAAGEVKHVFVSTPPGATPVCWMPTPANDWGSPVALLKAIVNVDGTTLLGAEPESGLTSFKPAVERLFETVCYRDSRGHRVTTVGAADGGETTVMVDWDSSIVMFWIDSPGTKRMLAVAACLPRGGLAATVVDIDLRPIFSGSALQRKLDR
ncbi:hypothetical protein SAMN06296378_2935 [Salinibacterium xinjiangense]|uniref:Uncharacterized protein n=1 Tax=Salinibacterium xinjiangense TaxID=386302 RepID=A0A2C9A3I7_9MICO|nr:hypothetical protein [Salinibacterium xinjiangense]SOE74055.1 hypothetical protein SAMN06296378_2935 [Salinibacterium xinjiangense]